MHSRQGFTLIELLVVIAIIAILAVVVVLTLNPAELLRQSRDANRVSDMATLVSAVNLYNTDQSSASSFSMGSQNTVYVSIPDPMASTTAGDQCQGLNLPFLPLTYSYHCVESSTYRQVNGNGWIPVNLSNISGGAPIGNLPVDPVDQSSSRLYYTYETNGTQFEVTSPMESAKYKLGGSGDVISPDGGTLASVYEKGTKLGLLPLDYGDSSLVGYWPLNEGNGSTTYDWSGSNNTGTWNGSTTNGSYYTGGKIQNYAGVFSGSNTSISTGVNNLPTGSSPITMLMWLDASSSQGSLYPTLYSLSGGGYSYQLGLQNTSTPYSLRPCVASLCPVLNTINAGQWTMAGFTFSGGNSGTIIVYINGVAVSSITGGTQNVQSSTSLIGNANGSYPFEGALSNIRIYSRVLSSAEIAALYTAGK